jgi:hypothetical protein
MMLATLLLCLTLVFTPWYAYAQAQQFDRSVTNTNGLIAWWKATRGFMYGPLAYDLIGRTHATLTNMATTGTTSGWAAPTRSNSLGEIRFDGSNDRLILPVAPYLETPAQTMMLWMKSLAWGGDYRALFTINAGGGNVRELLVDLSGRLALYFQTSGGAPSIDPSSTALTTGVWYHVAWSYSAMDGLRAYINCKQEATAAAAGTLNVTNAQGAFGVNFNSLNRHFQGSMDDMRIYNRVVPPNELCAIMNTTTLEATTTKSSQPLGFVAATVAFVKSRFLYFFRKQ